MERSGQWLLGPDLVTWQLLALGYPMVAGGTALLLQVAQPQVGAGVAQFSDYQRQPWRRLSRTVRLYSSLVYATRPQAEQLGQQLRQRHQHIRGVDAQGQPYHALEHHLMAWVHATLAYELVHSLETFRGPLQPWVTQAYWEEQLRLAEVMGIDPQALPVDWPAFCAWYRQQLRGLQVTPTAQEIWRQLARPPAPSGLPAAALPLWRMLHRPLGWLLQLLTGALLPQALATQLGWHWTPARRLTWGLLRAGGHVLLRLAPLRLRVSRRTRRRWRQLARPVPRSRRQLRRLGV